MKRLAFKLAKFILFEVLGQKALTFYPGVSV